MGAQHMPVQGSTSTSLESLLDTTTRRGLSRPAARSSDTRLARRLQTSATCGHSAGVSPSFWVQLVAPSVGIRWKTGGGGRNAKSRSHLRCLSACQHAHDLLQEVRVAQNCFHGQRCGRFGLLRPRSAKGTGGRTALSESRTFLFASHVFHVERVSWRQYSG